MEEKLKCPKCGSENTEGEYCFSEGNEGENYVERWGGCCHNCGATLQYKKVYAFIGFDEIYFDDDEED